MSTYPVAVRIRDGLGQAHYERMRAGMRGTLDLPPWEELPEGSREAHRRLTEYAVPTVVRMLVGAARDVPVPADGDLTDQQRRILTAIHMEMGRLGRPPTLTELADHTGSTVRAVAADLAALTRAGWIERVPLVGGRAVFVHAPNGVGS